MIDKKISELNPIIDPSINEQVATVQDGLNFRRLFSQVTGFVGFMYLDENVAVVGTTITVESLPSNIDDENGWVIVDPYTSECEIRKVTQITGRDLLVSALDYAHAAGDVVFWMTKPTANIKYFGAIGDYDTGTKTGSDDTLAINRAFIQSKFQDIPIYIPAGLYLADNSLFPGRPDGEPNTSTVQYIYGDGMEKSVIYSHATNDPSFDMIGIQNCEIKDFQINADDATKKPSVGMLTARLDTGDSAGWHRCNRIKIKGNFQTACLYEYASEENWYLDCHFLAGPESKAAVLITTTNIEGEISPNATIAVGAQSNNSHRFFGCRFNHDDAGYVNLLGLLAIAGGTSIQAYGCYFNYSGANTGGKGIYIYSNQAPIQPIFEGNLFHGSEMDYLLYLDITAGQIRSLIFRNNEGTALVNELFGTVDSHIVGNSVIDIWKTSTLEGSIELQGAVSDRCFLSARIITLGGQFEGIVYTDKDNASSFTKDDVNFRGAIYYDDKGDWVTPAKILPDQSNPIVQYGNLYVTGDALVRDITTLQDPTPIDGKRVTVIILHDNKEIVFDPGDGDHNNLYGNAGANWFPDARDHMNCVYYDGNWYCDISDNT